MWYVRARARRWGTFWGFRRRVRRPIWGAVLAVVLLRLLGGAARYRDLPMAPLCAGGVCYCLLHAGLGVAAGGGLTAILAGAAEALLILGLGYFLTVFLPTRCEFCSKATRRLGARCTLR